MKKELRQKIHFKYCGKCAYCGKNIEYKDMQVDHIIPNTRFYVQSHKDAFKVDDFENLNPACRSCNHYKATYTLEEYRLILKVLHTKLERKPMNRVAINYGIIKLEQFDGKFYFEKGKSSISIH